MASHQFELTGLPRLVEPRLERTVEGQDDEPTSLRDGLNPVEFMTRWRGRTKPDIHRGIRVDDDSLCLAANAWEPLVSLEHRAGLVVIDNK